MPSRFLLFLKGQKKGSGREGSGAQAAGAARRRQPPLERLGGEAPGLEQKLPRSRGKPGSSPAPGPAWRGVGGANRAHCTGNHCPLQAASETRRPERRGSLSPEKLANPTSRGRRLLLQNPSSSRAGGAGPRWGFSQNPRCGR